MKRNPAPLILAVFVALPLVAASPFAGWHVAATWWERDWVETSARVVDAQASRAGSVVISKCSGNAPQHFKVSVDYAYEVKGDEQSASRFSYREKSEIVCGAEEAKSRAAEYQKMGKLPIWYDPAEPIDAVIERADVAAAILLGVFYVVGLSVFALCIRRWRRSSLTPPPT